MTAAPDPAGRIHELEEEIAALKRRMQEYETLLECIPVAVAIAKDPDCVDIRLNRAGSNLLGVNQEVNASRTGPDANELPFRVFANGSEVKDTELPMQVAAREGRAFRDVELDIVRNDGSVLHELCLAEPLLDASGHPAGSIGVFIDVTERRRMEQALRESEARYRFLADALPQIVWISNLDNQIIYINNYWIDYTGLKLEQSLAGDWVSVLHPDDLPHLLRVVASARKAGSGEMEYRLRRASDGEWRWHVARIRLVRMLDGEQQWLGTSAEIHDRKLAREQLEAALTRELELRRQAEEALADQKRIENQLMLLVEAASTLMAVPDSNVVLSHILELARRFVGADAYAVWRTSDDGKRWNVVAEHGLSQNYSRVSLDEEKTGRSLPQTAIAIEDVTQLPLLARRLEFYREESIRSMLLVPLSIHGRTEGTISLYYREPHKFSELENRMAVGIASLAAAAIGTAELYERQTQLRFHAEAAEKRASFLAEAGRVLSSSLDIETTLSSVAELAVPAVSDWVTVDILEDSGELRRLAVKHSDPAKVALAKEYSRRYPAEQNPEMMRALRTGTPILVREIPPEVFAGRDDDEQMAIIRQLDVGSYIIVPLISAGRTLGLLCFVGAESRRRFDESDLMLAEELAGRAATAISNARLYREQKASQEALQRFNTELKRANEDLNQFAYSASHDLKEPLRMVAIYSQLLEARHGDQLSETARMYLDHISKGATRMDLLIRDILAYTQAASDMPVADISPASAGAALQMALQNLEASIRESDARITFDELPDLTVKQVHLVQLFQNLLSNAIKYRGTEPPRIHLQSARDGNFWKISVIDNGIGVAPQYAEQIFGIFTRLHSTEKYSGTGIGLAICLKIVERYGGRIGVDSEEGQGATFWFNLP